MRYLKDSPKATGKFPETLTLSVLGGSGKWGALLNGVRIVGWECASLHAVLALCALSLALSSAPPITGCGGAGLSPSTQDAGAGEPGVQHYLRLHTEFGASLNLW